RSCQRTDTPAPQHVFTRARTILNTRVVSVNSSKRNAQQANSPQFAGTTRSCQRTDTPAPEHVFLRPRTTLNPRVASVKSAKRNAQQANSPEFANSQLSAHKHSCARTCLPQAPHDSQPTSCECEISETQCTASKLASIC